ncbi:ROK family glucokinase [bacterium]|nr:ROK family glucokinase [bacterium]
MGKVLFIGVDLGGTNIKAGSVSDQGKVLKEMSISTEADKGQAHVLGRIIQVIQDVAEGSEIGGVGIGIPGQINVERGICYFAPNLPGWKDVSVTPVIKKKLGCPVVLDNDANVAALGEFAYGAGQGSQHLLMVTLGTGVGGGLVLNGRIFRGFRDLAGEFGHITVDCNGHTCSCGRKGCIEEYASIRGIVRMVREALDAGVESSLRGVEKLTPREIYHDAVNGDTLAIEAFQRAGDYLGIALADVANLLNIERVVVGGGIANAGNFILEAARARVQKDALPEAAESVEIVKAQLGNSAGLVGAAYLARSID